MFFTPSCGFNVTVIIAEELAFSIPSDEQLLLEEKVRGYRTVAVTGGFGSNADLLAE
jgi:hypothetical protein